MKESVEILDSILKATSDPSKKITGEALNIYNDFKEWGWFDHFDINDESNRWMYITMISQIMYRHLRWEHENPKTGKQQLSKWERVKGLTNK